MHRALLGGWPAGYAAMDAFRHKTRKASFQFGAALATLPWVLAAAAGIYFGAR